MGRYSEPLAARFADLAGVRPGQRALDVGCGPGALTAELVGRLGAGEVCAVDPSESSPRRPGSGCRGATLGVAAAEQLPFAGRRVRRRPRPARRALHGRPGGGPARDGPGDPPGRGGRRVCVGPRRRPRPAQLRSGGPRASWIRQRPTNRGWPASARASSPGSSGRPGCRGERRHADGPGLLRHVRPVVAALHARRRPGRGLRGVADHAAAPPAARTLPGAAGRGPDSTSARPRGRSPAAADPPRDHRLRRNAFAIGADASAPTPPPSTSTAKARSPR